MLKKAIVICGSLISLFLVWFAVSDYRATLPIAKDTLRGFALTLTAAIEHVAQRDPSFKALTGLHPSSVAFFSIIDRKGITRFHSNPELIGMESRDSDAPEVIKNGINRESTVVLGTGERAYAFYAPLHIGKNEYALQLTLHTFRANAIIRRARIRVALLAFLLSLGWVLAVVIYRFASRDEAHRRDMALRENLARLGEMGALLAHEIRNPLAGIKGYAQIIAQRPQDGRNQQFAGNIVTEARRLESLVNDLLDYARREEYAMAEVDLGELMGNFLSLLHHEAGPAGVTVEYNAPPGLRVTGNRDRLGQVFLNLGRNAIQAMPDGGVLGLSADSTGGNVKIRISDTGRGIKSEDLERIFEPFFTTKARGTGLGLPLCRKIITEHSGSISVESNEGAGTSVTISMPLAEENFMEVRKP
jgi:two-component system sensor histidine kinase HydH